MSRRALFFLLFLGVLLALPFPALANPGLSEFGGPLDTFLNTITGNVGKSIAILAVACVGIYFGMNKGEVTETTKQGFGVAFAICFICFAPILVNKMYSFSGAML